jgi:N-acetylglutamate synthase-like GNAT family acetyltransferase
VNKQIEIKKGSEVLDLVDPFYEKHGSQGRARPDDLFFLYFEDKNLLGCVRFCLEEGKALLRTMMVDETARRKKIGSQLLYAFENYLIKNNITETYCLPYSHLEKFYGQIGFKKAAQDEIPPFLSERLQNYLAKGKYFICMKRTSRSLSTKPVI